jgi:hypothetical protein
MNVALKPKHLILPDTQVKPGVPTDHLAALGNFIVEKRPDVIVHIGDHFDMPSLSLYDKPGCAKKEGARYVDDIHAGHVAMDRLFLPIDVYNDKMRRQHGKLYLPRKEFCIGNHEYRIQRAIEADPVRFEGVISMDDMQLERWGWNVHAFGKPVTINGVSYAHFFVNPDGLTDKPVGGKADYKLTKVKTSFVMGHQQMVGISQTYSGIGKRMRGLVVGIFYMHDEDYLGYQKNQQCPRGVFMLHEVDDGDYFLCEVSMQYLLENYL